LGSVATGSYSIAHIIVVALIELFGIEVACPKLARPCYLSRFIKTLFFAEIFFKRTFGVAPAQRNIRPNLVPQFQRQGGVGRNQSLRETDVDIATN
jgi:hypothetical protein